LIASNVDGAVSRFKYNGFGQRTEITVASTTTEYVLDVAGGLPEVIVATTGGASTRYVQIQGQILAQYDSGTWAYVAPDALGSVRQLADTDGHVTLAQHYDPFGNLLETSGLGTSEFGYTGEWWDSYMELVYLRARWYMPRTGTFLSKDIFETEPPYLYVRDNPVNRTDPSGHGVCDDWSGPLRKFCFEAENGNLEAIEGFYRVVAIRNRVQKRWYLAADLLDHYLDGTTTPGEPYYIFDREWVLKQEHEKEREAYQNLLTSFVIEHLESAAASCHYSNPIVAVLSAEGVKDDFNTEIRGVLGEHTIKVTFIARLNSSGTWYQADTDVYYEIDDYYDFDPDKGIEVYQYGIGTVPHDWLVELRDAQMAAEFDVYVLFNEHLKIQGDLNETTYIIHKLTP
jgi:RHS repeat-associated protein